MTRKDSAGKYEVLIDFTDGEDGLTVYRAGKDRYPRAGYDPSDERINYLQSDINAFGKPVITNK